MMGLLPMPFTLDAEWLLKENVPLAGRMIEAGKERSGQQVFAPANASDNATDYRNIRARISCRRDDAFLYVTFHFDRLKQEEIMNDGIQKYLSALNRQAPPAQDWSRQAKTITDRGIFMNRFR